VAAARKATSEIRIMNFLKSFGVKVINVVVVTSNELTDNCTGLVTSGLVPDVTRGPPVDSSSQSEVGV
jgi:hypothetical protein